MYGKKGFTLIELLVVIAIIALLMAILIPALTLNERELVLTEKYEKINFIRSRDSESSTTKHKISVDTLIELIKEHGQRA